MRNDITRQGGRVYTDEQRDVALAHLKTYIGERNAISSRLLETKLQIPGRVLRAIIRDLERDGEILLGGGDDGIFVAEYQEEVDEKTARDRAGAISVLQRCDWRDKHKVRLPKRQHGLFDA